MFRVQFASATFSALESSGEILITIIIISGRILNASISVNVNFSETTATGKFTQICIIVRINQFIAGTDFNTTSQIAIIPAGTTNTTVRVAVTNDNIVEGDEMFSMSLNIPSSLGPGVVAGSITSSTGIIIDSSTIRVRFTRAQYTGSEATGFVMVTLVLFRGTSSNPFNVTITPSEQSPVSAEGNSVMCMIMC